MILRYYRSISPEFVHLNDDWDTVRTYILLLKATISPERIQVRHATGTTMQKLRYRK